MKSALELALEKTDDLVDDDAKLTPEQQEAIDQIKSEYEAKWAEQEIVLKGKVTEIQQDTDPQTFAEHQRQFASEMQQVKDKIYAERDEKVDQIRALR